MADLSAMTAYLTEFFRSKRDDYIEMMRDAGGSRYPPGFKGEEKIIQYIRDIAHNVDEHFCDLSIPQSYTTPGKLLEALAGLQKMAESYVQEALDINVANGGVWLNSIEYCYRMSDEVASAVKHGLSLAVVDAVSPTSALDRLSLTVRRLPNVARQLRARRKDKGVARPTLEINDEYDVQDLLHAVLKIDFDDVRPEEWTPSYGGANKRADFLLKNEQIIIEVKKTRDALQQTRVVEELTIDIDHYRNHPNCQSLVCMVWDTDHLIHNEAALVGDLEKSHPNFLRVFVVR